MSPSLLTLTLSQFYVRSTYSPVCGEDGTPFKVVEYTMDVTRDKMLTDDYESQVRAIGKSQAVVEFSMEGEERDEGVLCVCVCVFVCLFVL